MLDADARFPHEQVDGLGTEEKLMRDAIDCLPAEVPRVELNLDAFLLRMRQAQRFDVDLHPVRRRLLFPRCFALPPHHRPQQRRLADTAFAHEDHFGLVERFCLLQTAQIRPQFVEPGVVGTL